MNTPRLIAIDWGTTQLRVRLLGDGAMPLDERRAPVGVMAVPERRFEAALRALCADWIDGHRVPLVASGMVGSRQGWVEAPYLEVPATLAQAAAQLVRVPLQGGAVLHLVPGLCCRAGRGDVMRGEETQLWGAALEAGEVCVLPGTHSKWAWMGAGGAVQRFGTFMTGELYAVLLQHSILGRLAAVPPQPCWPAFEQGVQDALAEPERLTQLLFGVRSGALLGLAGADEGPDRLSGLLLGAELAAVRAQGLPARVHLLGEAALVERYERALRLAGAVALPVAAEATLRGQWRLAQAAGLVA